MYDKKKRECSTFDISYTNKTNPIYTKFSNTVRSMKHEHVFLFFSLQKLSSSCTVHYKHSTQLSGNGQ